MDTKRLILFVIFSFSLILLWDSFQRQNTEIEEPKSIDASLPKPSADLLENTDLPKSPSKFKLNSEQSIIINTDLLELKINTVGGDIRELKFNKHLADDTKNKYLLMTDIGNPLFYVAQSGLLGDNLPTHKSVFTSTQNTFQMNSDTLIVPLTFESNGLLVKKIYTFTKNSHLIKVSYDIKNNSFLKDLFYLMNNPTFKNFYKKYCDTWININTVIMYFKLYEIIEVSYYNKFNKKITQKDMLFILNNIIKNSLLRQIVINNYELYKSSDTQYLISNNIKYIQ